MRIALVVAVGWKQFCVFCQVRGDVVLESPIVGFEHNVDNLISVGCTQLDILHIANMQLIYGFVYYFLLFFVALTFCLIIFALKPARRLLQHIQVKYNSILENVWFTYLINFSFAVILLIMIDSIRAFYSISQSMGTHDERKFAFGMQRLDVLKESDGRSMMGSLKELREYYLAERNIMLTFSSCFVYFVFQRLMFNIRKFTNQEYKQEHPEDTSNILEEPTNNKFVRAKQD